jgi:CheY-like chemotaxis protein
MNEADRIRVQVIDTGVGIEPGRLPTIFDAFEQGGRTRQFGGLGLGLAITKSIVDLHHGRIEAASDGPGKGTSITVEMPVVTDGDGSESSAGSVDLKSSTDSAAPVKRSILLVEDHGPSAVVIRRLLVRWGHDVALATGVQGAKDLAANRTFDLVISDLGLPDGNGHDLMQHLRDTYGLSGIAVSGFGMEADVQRSLSAGFAGHLTKPIDFEELRKAVTASLGGAAPRR